MLQSLAGLVYGEDIHHLDHIAPMCSLLNIPLVVSEDPVETLARAYYPNLKIFCWDYAEFGQQFLQQFSTVISPLARPVIKEIIFLAEQLLGKNLHSIWCPHGNSDKGKSSFFMEALRGEEGGLVYGPKMIDFLLEKKVLKKWKGHVSVGNYRYLYYLKHKEHFDAVVEREIFAHLPEASHTFLYAPTWKDSENSSSFFEACAQLCANLPPSCRLIVKLHPNLLSQDPLRIEKTISPFEQAHNIRFLQSFPLIYPLLDQVDAYIGDMSSIGYDFLTFNKPMFFLNPRGKDAQRDPSLYLFRAGREIPMTSLDKFYPLAIQHMGEDQTLLIQIRNEILDYTFGKKRPWPQIEKEIFALASRLSESDIM